MSESDFEQPADVSQYGAWRARQHRAHLEQSAANGAAAELEAHRPVSGHLRAAHQGMYDMLPQEQAAIVAAQRRVGDGAGAGRDLVAQGGAFTHHLSGPAPARVSLVGQDAPPGYQRDENPLVHWSRENR